MSTPFVPLPMLGQHVTSGVLYGLALGDGGVLTPDESVTLVVSPSTLDNVGRSIRLTDEVEVVEINGLNTTQRNEVVLSDGWTLGLEIFLVNNGNDPNPLFELFGKYNNLMFVYSRGTVAGSTEVITFYGRRGNITTDVQGRGEQMCDATLGPIDPGIAQVSRTLS